MIQFHLQSKSHQLEEHLQCLDAAESDKVLKNELSLIISMEKLSFVAEKLRTHKTMLQHYFTM